MRSRTLLYAGLLLLLAPVAAPGWFEAAAAPPPGVELRLDHGLRTVDRARAILPRAPASDSLRLVLARELRSAPAGEKSVLPLEAILGAILLFLAANIVVLLGFSIVMRIRREYGQRRRDRFSAVWEPVLHARISGDAAPLPALAPSERLLFLNLWLHLSGYVRDQAADALVSAARELDMPAFALRLLESRSSWKRVVAMRAIAAMELTQAGDILLAKVMQGRRRSSLAAARALLQIDPERGFAGLKHLLDHLEWAPAAVVEVVRAGGVSTIERLAGLASSAAAGRATQIVRLIELVEDQTALPALRRRLASSSDEEEIAAILHCIGKLGRGEDRAVVLGYLGDERWLIRMQAAYALGAIGLGEDVARLAPLLRDRQWWVRYRAAQSLLRLTGAAAIKAMRDREPDPYAREMLERVLVEGG